MTPLARAALFPFALAAIAFAQEKPEALPKDSPFRDRRQPTTAVAAASETLEFAGVNEMAKRRDIIFYDKAAKKSYWITEGDTKEGITVLKYDPRREQVVVKVNGTEKILQLRKSAPVNANGAVVSVNPAGFNVPPPAIANAMQAAPAPTTVIQATPPQPKAEAPATPEAQQKQETEARMLVSDLLEIGMAQRKAYEEAQRKAASGESTPAAPANQPPPASADKPNGS